MSDIVNVEAFQAHLLLEEEEEGFSRVAGIVYISLLHLSIVNNI